MVDKFCLQKASVDSSGRTLYRIMALKDFYCMPSKRMVKKGDIGGYVESVYNLSQGGTCWVFDNAVVQKNAKVTDDACILNSATISDNCLVRGRAVVSDDCVCSKNAIIQENATIKGNCIIAGCSHIYGEANLSGNTTISGNVLVAGKVDIVDSMISGNVFITGKSRIFSSKILAPENEKIKIDAGSIIKDSFINLGFRITASNISNLNTKDFGARDGSFPIIDGKINSNDDLIFYDFEYDIKPKKVYINSKKTCLYFYRRLFGFSNIMCFNIPSMKKINGKTITPSILFEEELKNFDFASLPPNCESIVSGIKYTMFDCIVNTIIKNISHCIALSLSLEYYLNAKELERKIYEKMANCDSGVSSSIVCQLYELIITSVNYNLLKNSYFFDKYVSDIVDNSVVSLVTKKTNLNSNKLLFSNPELVKMIFKCFQGLDEFKRYDLGMDKISSILNMSNALSIDSLPF